LNIPALRKAVLLAQAPLILSILLI